MGGPPWFGDIEMYPHGFGNDLLLLIYVYMLFILLIFSMSCFKCSLCHMPCLLETPMFNMDLYLCVLTVVLTIVYIIDLMHVHLHNDHMSFVLISMLHVLITCLDVSFH